MKRGEDSSPPLSSPFQVFPLRSSLFTHPLIHIRHLSLKSCRLIQPISRHPRRSRCQHHRARRIAISQLLSHFHQSPAQPHPPCALVHHHILKPRLSPRRNPVDSHGTHTHNPSVLILCQHQVRILLVHHLLQFLHRHSLSRRQQLSRKDNNT